LNISARFSLVRLQKTSRFALERPTLQPSAVLGKLLLETVNNLPFAPTRGTYGGLAKKSAARPPGLKRAANWPHSAYSVEKFSLPEALTVNSSGSRSRRPDGLNSTLDIHPELLDTEAVYGTGGMLS
jgi:hypothetical protein